MSIPDEEDPNCLLGNVGNLPLVLIDSLTSGPAATALFGSAAGLDMQYVMLSNLSATFIQFPLISHFLRPSDSSGGSNQPLPWWESLRQAVCTPPIISALVALCIGQVPQAKVIILHCAPYMLSYCMALISLKGRVTKQYY